MPFLQLHDLPACPHAGTLRPFSQTKSEWLTFEIEQMQLPEVTLPTRENLLDRKVDSVCALIDTKAHISVMSANLLTCLCTSDAYPVAFSSCWCLYAGHRWHARTSRQHCWPEHHFRLFVLDKCPRSVVIFGLDFLSEYAAIINCSTGLLHLKVQTSAPVSFLWCLCYSKQQSAESCRHSCSSCHLHCHSWWRPPCHSHYSHLLTCSVALPLLLSSTAAFACLSSTLAPMLKFFSKELHRHTCPFVCI